MVQHTNKNYRRVSFLNYWSGRMEQPDTSKVESPIQETQPSSGGHFLKAIKVSTTDVQVSKEETPSEPQSAGDQYLKPQGSGKLQGMVGLIVEQRRSLKKDDEIFSESAPQSKISKELAQVFNPHSSDTSGMPVRSRSILKTIFGKVNTLISCTMSKSESRARGKIMPEPASPGHSSLSLSSKYKNIGKVISAFRNVNTKKKTVIQPEVLLGRDEIVKKFHRALRIIRVLYRLRKISEDIQLYGTSSNLFDLTTRDRSRVKQTIYPRIYDEEEHHKQEEKDLPWFILAPRNKLVQVWSIVIIFLLLYSATVMPYRLTFAEGRGGAWMAIEYTVDALFWFDLILNFISAYYDDEGVFVQDPKILARNYIKTWFIIDFISVLPFDLIQQAATGSEQNSSRYNELLRLARVPRLYRLLKITKILKVLKFMKGGVFHEYFESYSGVLRIVSFMLSVCLLVHIVGCLWFFIAKLDNFAPDTWVVRLGMVNKDNFSIYLASIYYVFSTLTTVGYGDIMALTVKERVFSIIWMIFSVGFYSFTIGILTSTFSNRDTRESSLKRKITLVNEFAKEVKAPKSLKDRIKRVLEYNSLKNCFSWADKKNIFSEIPINLRYEVVMHMHNGVLSEIPFFKEHGDKYFVVTIASYLKPIIVKAQDKIWSKETSPESVYFLTKGRMNYIAEIYLTDEDRRNRKIVPPSPSACFNSTLDTHCVQEDDRWLLLRGD